MRLATAALLLLATSVAAQADLGVEPETTQPSPGIPEEEGFFSDGIKWAIGGTGLTLAGIGIFLAMGGLRHVDNNNVLEHPLRKGIMESVSDQPGVHLRELATLHDTAVTNTQWHLRKLEQAGLIRTQKVGGRRLFYPTQGGIATKQEAVENAATSNPNADRIFGFIQEHIGCDVRQIMEGLGMNPGTIRWHLRRLKEAGLLSEESHGNHVYYFPAKIGLIQAKR